jgi:hypothetical protein
MALINKLNVNIPAWPGSSAGYAGAGHALSYHHYLPASHRHHLHPRPQLARLLAAGRHGGLIVYTHGIDFGAKGYGNLAELSWPQCHVAGEL